MKNATFEKSEKVYGDSHKYFTKYAKSVVNCQEDLVKVVNSSSPNGYNVELPSVDPRSKIRNFEWKKWDEYLPQSFDTISGTT